jgi:hypothetical protein
LWEGWNVASEGGVVDFVDEDSEESCSLVIRIGLELRVDFDNERRSDGRKQTGLIR